MTSSLPNLNGIPLVRRLAKDGTRRGRPKGSIPPKYSDAQCHHLFELLRDGITLRKAAEQAGFSSPGIILAWAMGDDNHPPPIPDFSERFARATRIGWEAMSYDLLDEAEAAKSLENMAGVTAIKNKMDVVRWLLARRVPDQFGDKLQVAQTGGGATIHVYMPKKDDPTAGAKIIEGEASELEQPQLQHVEDSDQDS